MSPVDITSVAVSAFCLHLKRRRSLTALAGRGGEDVKCWKVHRRGANKRRGEQQNGRAHSERRDEGMEGCGEGKGGGERGVGVGGWSRFESGSPSRSVPHAAARLMYEAGRKEDTLPLPGLQVEGLLRLICATREKKRFGGLPSKRI